MGSGSKTDRCEDCGSVACDVCGRPSDGVCLPCESALRAERDYAYGPCSGCGAVFGTFCVETCSILRAIRRSNEIERTLLATGLGHTSPDCPIAHREVAPSLARGSGSVAVDTVRENPMLRSISSRLALIKGLEERGIELDYKAALLLLTPHDLDGPILDESGFDWDLTPPSPGPSGYDQIAAEIRAESAKVEL